MKFTLAAVPRQRSFWMTLAGGEIAPPSNAAHVCGPYPRIVKEPPIPRGGRVADAIRDAGLVFVLRRVGPRQRLLDLVDELAQAGGRVFELTLDGDDAPADVAAARQRLADRGGGPCFVGAGTVRTAEQLVSAIDAGAAFGVSPVLDPPILAAAIEAGLPFVPGAYTPTEADIAWRAGATFVKLFPGSSLGASHVRELRGPLPEIETIVTGGIDGTNAISFLEAGATAVGIGSAIVRATADERRTMIAAITTAVANARRDAGATPRRPE
jgi:2-dehydro-3-deoxyphosphogluconate aldolase/(4S)-4-hydroxy-2-oxoglutarate aldolase